MPGRRKPDIAPLGVVLRRVEDLEPYAKNAREHTPAQVEQLKRSLVEFGWTNPVLIGDDDGIIAGHGRVVAAKALWAEDSVIPGLMRGMVPCIRLAHLTPEQRRAYVIADNKLALNAGWDLELLKLELGELKLSGFNLELTGFAGLDLDAALGGAIVDPNQAWGGMPAYENVDQWSKYRLHVHFATLDDLNAFAKLIGQTLTETTRAIWYPAAPVSHQANNRYVSTEPSPAGASADSASLARSPEPAASPRAKRRTRSGAGAGVARKTKPSKPKPKDGRRRHNGARKRDPAPAGPAAPVSPEPELPLIAEAV